MHWFSRTPHSIIVLALSLPSVAFAQSTGQPAAPPAGAGGAPGSSPTPPPSPSGGGGSSGAVPSGAPSAGAAPAPTPSAPPTGSAPIDRGSLLPPTPAPRPGATPAPAEPRDGDHRAEPPPAPTTTTATTPPTATTTSNSVYAEDWWVHSRPVFELHGYLRVRAELFHNFALGRIDSRQSALWPQPLDNSFVSPEGPQIVPLCGDTKTAPCEDKSQAGANMRFRVNPELHISDNLRIISQIDMLDNLVLGSTPGGYASQVTAAALASPYVPIGAFAPTQVEPIANTNSFRNSVAVKRAWGEYATPIGQLRFGRQPNHWGLGMVENSGDTYDSDWQSTVDRIMFTTGIKSLDLYFSGAWDFPSEGPTSATFESIVGGQPYDLAQLDDVNQYTGMIARRRNPELAKLDLARGDVVLNGGVYFQWRDQYLASENVPLGTTSAQIQAGTTQATLVRRGLHQYTPDLWFQLLYKKFRFETEGVMIIGSLDSVSTQRGTTDPFNVRQFGVATQLEWKAVEDRLRLNFGAGWASGDSGLIPEGSQRTSTLSPLQNGSQGTLNQRVGGNRTYSEFRFHPDYRIDLILNRNILGRIQGEYYLRPSVDYDFTRNAEGQKLGGGAAVIWTRASEYLQSPGHKRDLGIELDLTVYYQSKDGSLNDNPAKMGGFFTMAQYGVLFPLGGLGYMPGETTTSDTSAAHIVRWFLGVMY